MFYRNDKRASEFICNKIINNNFKELLYYRVQEKYILFNHWIFDIYF